MEQKFDVNFYFPDISADATVEYRVSAPPAPFSAQLLVYSLHAARALVNTAHSTPGQELAALMVDSKHLIPTFCQDPFFRAHAFDGHPEKMRVMLHSEIRDGTTTAFNLKLKGFGLLGDRATIGCVRSVGLHFNYLAMLYHEHSLALEQLLLNTKGCGQLALDGDLTITNQHRAAAAATAFALERRDEGGDPADD